MEKKASAMVEMRRKGEGERGKQRVGVVRENENRKRVAPSFGSQREVVVETARHSGTPTH